MRIARTALAASLGASLAFVLFSSYTQGPSLGAAPARARVSVSAPARTFSRALRFTPNRCERNAFVHAETEQQSMDIGRRKFGQSAGTAAAAGALMYASPKKAMAAKVSAWERLQLPVSETTVLFDIDFVDDKTAYLVGSQGCFLQTTDGGVNWKEASLSGVIGSDEDINYRWESVSFDGQEGWAVGKPAIMIHTTDGGQSWERIPFSAKLPGDFLGITALGEGNAEVITSAGAIYKTQNAGKNWKAQVLETIDATLNRVSSSGVSGASYYSGSINSVKRDEKGQYIGVNARGNFYLTFKPGSDAWMPHNRKTIRRIVTMGVLGEDLTEGMWMTTRAGGVSFVKGTANLEQPEIDFVDSNIQSGGYGILDVTKRPNGDLWCVGGGGKIFLSRNGGKTWTADSSGDDQPANFYRVKFFEGNKGFILGSAGVLMRYTDL